MLLKDIPNERIPMFVESPRGDDRMGTNASTGSLISDHEAREKGVPFEAGVPKEKIQEAVEKQLKDEKWVVIEKKDGSSDLLTKKDIPQLEKEGENDVPEERTDDEETEGDGEETGTGSLDNSDTPEKPVDDWRKSFGAVPVNPKAASAVVKPACTAVPKKEKEEWKSKFDDIKSAAATHKGKGG